MQGHVCTVKRLGRNTAQYMVFSWMARGRLVDKVRQGQKTPDNPVSYTKREMSSVNGGLNPCRLQLSFMSSGYVVLIDLAHVEDNGRQKEKSNKACLAQGSH